MNISKVIQYLAILPLMFVLTISIAQERTIEYDNSDIQSFIDNVPNNSVVIFPNQEIFYEEVLVIRNKETVEFRFKGFKIQSETIGKSAYARRGTQNTWPRNRCHILIQNSNNIQLSGLVIRGPHEKGGTGTEAYVSKLEAQHGIEINNSKNVTIENCEISHIYGDGVYIGRQSRDIIISNCTIHHNGRQGIAITNARNVLISKNNIHDIRRAHIDLEPNTAKDTVENVEISQNTFGRKRLHWIAAASGGGVVREVTIKNNLLNCPGSIWIGNVKNRSRQGPYHLIDNKSTKVYGTKSGGIWRVINVDRFMASGNTILAQPNRNMYLLRATNTKDIELENNTVPNGSNGIKP